MSAQAQRFLAGRRPLLQAADMIGEGMRELQLQEPDWVYAMLNGDDLYEDSYSFDDYDFDERWRDEPPTFALGIDRYDSYDRELEFADTDRRYGW